MGIPQLLVIFIPTVVFVYWGRPFLQGGLISYKRTFVAFACVAIASGLNFGVSWQEGLRYQGRLYARTTGLISLAYAVVLMPLLILSRRSSSLPLRLAVNFLIFAWAFTYALTWLGETP